MNMWSMPFIILYSKSKWTFVEKKTTWKCKKKIQWDIHAYEKHCLISLSNKKVNNAPQTLLRMRVLTRCGLQRTLALEVVPTLLVEIAVVLSLSVKGSSYWGRKALRKVSLTLAKNSGISSWWFQLGLLDPTGIIAWRIHGAPGSTTGNFLVQNLGW